jgi:hypothetical protein
MTTQYIIELSANKFEEQPKCWQNFSNYILSITKLECRTTNDEIINIYKHNKNKILLNEFDAKFISYKHNYKNNPTIPSKIIFKNLNGYIKFLITYG